MAGIRYYRGDSRVIVIDNFGTIEVEKAVVRGTAVSLNRTARGTRGTAARVVAAARRTTAHGAPNANALPIGIPRPTPRSVPGTALGVLLRLLARAAPLQVPLFSGCCMVILSFLFLGQVRPSLVAKLEVKPDPNEQQAMRKTASQEHSPPCALNDQPQRTSHSSTMRPTDDPLAELETGAASGRPCGD